MEEKRHLRHKRDMASALQLSQILNSLVYLEREKPVAIFGSGAEVRG